MNRIKDSYIMAGMAILLISFFYLTGTITSGYHITDDHEILDILRDVKEAPILEVIHKWIKNDLEIRYRPMYFVHRVLQTAVFKDNFLLWSVYTIILCVSTFCFFYKAMRNLKFTVIESLFFNLVAFWGTQMCIWWMLGPNETIGTFLLSICFYFLSICKNDRNYTQHSLLFTLFLALSSLSKESFTLIIPAIILLKIWNEKEVFSLSFSEAVIKNRLQVFSILVLLFNLLVIVFYVGTNKIGYAGVDQDVLYKLKEINRIFGSLSKYLLILGITLLILLTLKAVFKDATRKYLLIPIIIFLLIVLPNILLHAKSGMTGRYFLPTTIGFAFLVTYLSREVKKIYSPVYFVLIIISVFILKKPIKRSAEEARRFASEGHDNKELFSTVLNLYNPSKNTLLAVDPVASFEATSSVSTYLNSKNNVKLYAYEIDDKTSRGQDSAFAKRLIAGWREWFPRALYKDMNGRPDIIIFLNKDMPDRFFSESGVASLDYVNKTPNNSRYSVFSRKE